MTHLPNVVEEEESSVLQHSKWPENKNQCENTEESHSFVLKHISENKTGTGDDCLKQQEATQCGSPAVLVINTMSL